MAFDDVTFLNNTREWPYMEDCESQYCAMRRVRDKVAEHAFLLSGNQWDLFLGSVFDGGTGEVIQFESPQAIIDAGWVVD